MAGWQRGGLLDGRVCLSDMGDAVHGAGSGKIGVVDAIPHEPMPALIVNHRQGWQSTIGNGPLYHSTEVRREPAVSEREGASPEDLMLFVGHAPKCGGTLAMPAPSAQDKPRQTRPHSPGSFVR